MLPSKKTVGLLTGTFDPVHLGHIALAKAAMSACDLHEVWFLVNPVPSHKKGASKLAHRVAMVRLAVASEDAMREGEPGCTVASHTTAEFKLLMSRYPDAEFVFIVGADVLSSIDSWDDADTAKQLNYVVAGRIGRPETLPTAELRSQRVKLPDYAHSSSRKVQAALRLGTKPPELDEVVYEYIQAHGVYGQ